MRSGFFDSFSGLSHWGGMSGGIDDIMRLCSVQDTPPHQTQDNAPFMYPIQINHPSRPQSIQLSLS